LLNLTAMPTVPFRSALACLAVITIGVTFPYRRT